MKKTNILIPAVLTTQTRLRIFVASTEEEVRNQPFSTDESYDRPLRLKNGQIPSHDTIISIIRRRFKGRDQKTGLERYGRAMRSRIWHNGVIIAYQVIVASTIVDSRRKFGRGHESTETDGTQALLTKKVFIFGKIISRAEVKRHAAWVREQLKVPPDIRDLDGFDKKGISAYTPLGAKRIPWKSKRPILKMGPATFIAVNPKTMEFRPLN